MDEGTDAAANAAPRAPYAAPVLARLGTLVELTHAVKTNKVNDGGKGTLKRSQ
jgi:hypothetical protein